MAYGIVMKPIPGTGYGIGEPATFNKDQEEKYAEYLGEGSYLRPISKSEYEKLIKGDEPEDEEEAAEVKKLNDGETKKASAGEKR
jgi:hypothetical protein